MTSLARAVYSDTAADPAVLLDGGFAGQRELEDHLLDAFIPAAFAGPVTLGTRQRARPAARRRGALAVLPGPSPGPARHPRP